MITIRREQENIRRKAIAEMLYEAALTLLRDDINAGLKIIERYRNDNN